MTTHYLDSNKSILNNFVSEIRDIEIQKDPLRFRRNIERIGEIISFEISKTLDFGLKKIETPLGIKEMQLTSEEVVICSILRAGLPLHIGFLNYFDKAENAFVSAYRKHPNGQENFEIVSEYIATPKLDNKTLIIVDPMLATGKSLVTILDVLKEYGTPKNIHVVSVIAAREGVELVCKNFPEDSHLWIASLDEELNEKGYIIPGLGDAGDLCFGPKV